MRHSLAVPALLLAGATAAVAGDARIPVYAPLTIDAPGSYTLTRDITGSGTLITITADGVDLDLNGYALIGDGAGIGVRVFTAAGVRVRDGVIRGVSDGVLVLDSEAVTLRRLVIESPANRGISENVSAAVSVVECLVLNPGGTGIDLSGAGPYLLEFNDVAGATEDGLQADGEGSIIRGSRITGAGGSAGITSYAGSGTIFEGNHVLGGFRDGMLFFGSAGTRISGNVVQDVDGDGMLFFNDCLDARVAGNIVTAAGSDGLAFYSDRALADGNLTSRSGWGLTFFGNDNVIRRNVSRGNTFDYTVSSLSTGNVSSGDNYVPARQ